MKWAITYKRDEHGCNGFDCDCGHTYTAPADTVQNPTYRANLVDCMVRYHETQHKRGKIKGKRNAK